MPQRTVMGSLKGLSGGNTTITVKGISKPHTMFISGDRLRRLANDPYNHEQPPRLYYVGHPLLAYNPDTKQWIQSGLFDSAIVTSVDDGLSIEIIKPIEYEHPVFD